MNTYALFFAQKPPTVPNILSTDNLLVFILSIVAFVLIRRWWDQQKDLKVEQERIQKELTSKQDSMRTEQESVRLEHKNTLRELSEQLRDFNKNISSRIDMLEKNNQEVQSSQREILLNAKSRSEELLERFRETERSLREYSKESQDRLMHEVEQLKNELRFLQKAIDDIKKENEVFSRDVSYLLGRLGSPKYEHISSGELERETPKSVENIHKGI